MTKLDRLDQHPDIHRGLLSSKNVDNRISINQFKHGVSFFHNNVRLFNTRKALLLFEKDHAPVLYVPKSDIFKRHFLPSTNSSFCPYKGEANYWSFNINDEIVIDAAWEYAHPRAYVQAIEGHVAFANQQRKGQYLIYDI